ncbi:MAG: hypothetical protein CR982_06210 [Candidatus Cloacimonadota bacterium]|nr:MAG: hypothetical protein CR982_06210 [Candidatus Cloacimonadota bacterium]PIE78114.1 MAG: hypothetical protein CSA15_09770 [Candidatus Delongbacteria bacterium]
MIFNELANIWRKKDLLTQAISDSKEMLEIAYDIFHSIKNKVLDFEGDEVDLEEVKKKDYLLNHFERSIKKKVFEHVSLNDKEDQNLYSSFVLISIVGNIERLGDYTKNISEIVDERDRLKSNKYNKILNDLLNETDKLFKETLRAYLKTDFDKAQEINSIQHDIKSKVDTLVKDLIRDENSDDNLVIYALMFRYIKRVASHLMHISTSITNSIDNIGYYRDE